MFFIGSQQHALTIFNDPGRPSIMDILGGEKTQSQMIVPGIVPGEECLAKGPGILNGAEPFRELRPVFHGLELRFGVNQLPASAGSWFTSRANKSLDTTLRMQVQPDTDPEIAESSSTNEAP